MLKSEQPQTFISVAHTATDDSKFKLVTADMWFSSINIYSKTNHAYFGDRNNQEAPLDVGDVVYYDVPTNLNDIFFKNKTAGSNTTIIATGTLMLERDLKLYGLVD